MNELRNVKVNNKNFRLGFLVSSDLGKSELNQLDTARKLQIVKLMAVKLIKRAELFVSDNPHNFIQQNDIRIALNYALGILTSDRYFVKRN
jgi:hypothetical protein